MGSPCNFHEMGLDDRLLQAISKLSWEVPTLIQEKAIPLALVGKDILARGRTGSGKTGAFLIPLIQKLLTVKMNSTSKQEIRALVLAPSKELCKQINSHFNALTSSCGPLLRCIDVSQKSDIVTQRPLLMEKPDIVIGTPSQVLAHIQAKNILIQETLTDLIVDEADLIFSFGYKENVEELLKHLPRVYQSSLMSATLTPEVLEMKKLILHNPVVLKLEEPELPQMDQLTQYHIKCEEEEKFVLICALLKLNLIRGKTIIFVNNVDRCFKLKLFLEQFGVKSCVLNAELPVVSRCHIISQFNEGVYQIIIASDEISCSEIKGQKAKDKGKRKKDKSYGVSRGIDFQFVSNIVNFDFPLSVESYIHRVGRTARGNRKGTALSFVAIKDMILMSAVEKKFQESEGVASQNIFKPYQFKMEEIEGFRYRTRDALRAVTKIAVREARLKEIRAELLKSQKLKTYFEDNPRDLQALRHDKALHTVKLQSYLHDVPDYIVPPTLRKMVRAEKGKRGKKGNDSTLASTIYHDSKKRNMGRNNGARRKRKVEDKDPLRNLKRKK